MVAVRFTRRLEEKDFRDLVAGRVVTVLSNDGQPVKIILADIGFERMAIALADAMDEKKG